MKEKRPTRGTASRKQSQARGGRAKAREGKRPVDAQPRKRKPTGDGRPQRAAPQTSPVRTPARPKSTSQAKARAKARKAKAPKVVRPPLRQRILVKLASIDLRPRTLVERVPFVVLVIAALGTGLGVTLWLSTDAAERSYELGNARQVNQALMQQKEALERDVLAAQAAPALAEAARELGMIPSRDTAHLVQDAAGNWVVVGTPKPAEGVPPPPLNTPLPDPVPSPSARQVVEPLEVPVRIPSSTGALGVSGALPDPLQAGPVAPEVPVGVTPGVEVPHAVSGQLPGPVPPLPPQAPVEGVVPPVTQPIAPLHADPLQGAPDVAIPPGAPMGTEQFEPVAAVPGGPA